MTSIINPHSISSNRLERAFFSKIQFARPNQCWQWLGGIDYNGYSKVFQTQAHLFSYQFYKGNMEPGNHVTHTCQNRSCVNPRHLLSVPRAYTQQGKPKRKDKRFIGTYLASGKWVAFLGYGGHKFYLGRYLFEEDAAKAYDRKARELYGENANVNFPDDGGK